MTQKQKKSSTTKHVLSDTPILISDEMYNFNVWFWYGDRMAMVGWAQERFDLPLSDVAKIVQFPADCQMVPFTDNRTALIYLSKDAPLTSNQTLTALAHECQHVTYHVLTVRGLEYCTASEEAYCYHTSYVLKSILNKIKPEDKHEEP